jgi:hypothetical protein
MFRERLSYLELWAYPYRDEALIGLVARRAAIF